MENHSDQADSLLPRHYIPFSEGRERKQASKWFTWGGLVRISLLVLLLYIAIRVTTISAPGCIDQQSPLIDVDIDSRHFSLPKHMMKTEERPEWYPGTAPWNQGPSNELDDAWDDLLLALNIRVTSDELTVLNMNKTNRVQVTGGSPAGDADYVGVLGVYHHLHCLNNIRRLLDWDYYEPRMAGVKHTEGFSKEHANHCIDTIRQALMCHANTGLYTSEWDYEHHNPSRELESNSVTTCVKWQSVDNWARQRALILGEYKYWRGPYDPDRPHKD
ncbi:hypothetical protein F5X98DRAFT_378148 [Xylaria grammica]|nr:hypothetical protein F5X98DRAFT_378148 [Xylaria grammica]